MRVSSTFNSVAAPILYRSVSLKGSTGLSDYTLSGSGKELKSRISPTKNHNLDYINDVNFEQHHICPSSNAQCTRRILHVSLLQVSADPTNPNPTNSAWDRCNCLRGIAPRKLVFQNRVDYVSPFYGVQIAIDKTVVTTHHVFQNEYRYQSNFLLYAPKSGPMVIIFWSPPSDANEISEMCVRLWKILQGHLVEGAMFKLYPRELVLVNIERIAAADIGNVAGTKTLWEHAAQVNQEQFLERLDKHPGPHRPHGHTCCDNVKRARNTKFTFVTMRDYLKNWDWKGELTDEEVRPWLESQESVDEALESELEVEVGGE